MNNFEKSSRMTRSAFFYIKQSWTKNKKKIGQKLKLIFILMLIGLFFNPLRNALVPGWPVPFRHLSTWKVARIHVVDFFYPMDRNQYTGSCDSVHRKLAHVKMPKLEEMPVSGMSNWEERSARAASKMPRHLQNVLNRFKPTLTDKEMRELIFASVSITQALTAFNITHFLIEGSLVGQWRNHGLIPWDDDTDFLFDVSQWQLTKEVLSCLPDLELDIGSDYMWKVFHKNSDLWKGESFIKFPFVDIFPYKYDSEDLWPVTLWMKRFIVLPTHIALPPVKGVFEGWPVMVPHKTGPVLALLYGKVSSDCHSRIFFRRERQMVPYEQRSHLPCKYLNDVYPYVRRTKLDTRTNTVLEEKVVDGKVVFRFNTSFHGDTLDES